MREYAFRIVSRDKDHPLAETTILEFGVDAKHPDALANALGSLFNMLRIHTTPENVAEFMKRNAVLTTLKGMGR